MFKRLVDARSRRIAEIRRRGEGECAKFERGVGQLSACEEQVLNFRRAAGPMVGLSTLPEVQAEIEGSGNIFQMLEHVELNQFRGDAAGSRLPIAAPSDRANEKVPRALIFDRKKRGHKEHGESFRIAVIKPVQPGGRDKSLQGGGIGIERVVVGTTDWPTQPRVQSQ